MFILNLDCGLLENHMLFVMPLHGAFGNVYSSMTNFTEWIKYELAP